MATIQQDKTIPTSARTVVVQDYIRSGEDLQNLPSSIFAVKDVPLPEVLAADSVLVRTLYVSNDVAQTARIQKFFDVSSRKDISAITPVGAPMEAFSVSRVVKVGTEIEAEGVIKVGDLVEGKTP